MVFCARSRGYARHNSIFQVVWSFGFPLALFRVAPSFLSSSSQFFSVTMTVVKRPPRLPGSIPGPIPFVLAECVCATSSRSRVMACWWIPAGGHVCHRVLSFGVFRFEGLQLVPCGLERLRFVMVYFFTCPTGGQQSALQVSFMLYGVR